MATEPADLKVRPALGQRPQDRQRRVDVAAGTSGRDQDPHRRQLPRDWVSREIDSRIPTAAKLTSNDELPELTKGSVMPVSGSRWTTTPMLMNAWNVRHGR